MNNNTFEMVIGLVAPIGVSLDSVVDSLSKSIALYNYDIEVISVVNLPELILGKKLRKLSRRAIDNLSWHMPELRKIAHKHIKTNETDETDGSDIYAVLVVEYIRKLRRQKKDKTSTVYILDNLKHPKDIESLKRVYKKAFYSIGVTASINQRIEFKYSGNNNKDISNILEDSKGLNKAAHEIYEDYDFISNADRKNNWANATGDAYQLSDFFINLSNGNIEETLTPNIERFVDLICGAPIITPTPREHSMFMAYVSSIRSADLSRQVGATITNQDNDVIAMGANEIPQGGGGQYWATETYVAHTQENADKLKENPLDQRDYIQGFDANAKVKNEIFEEIVKSLECEGVISGDESTKDKVLIALKNTAVDDLTEFGRVVHAEMSSLMVAAKNGISVKNAHMYCTTYPCHNCAKHIVAAGIKTVEYIEPYPKSKANILHKDSIFDPDSIIEEGDISKHDIIEMMVGYYKKSKQQSPQEYLDQLKGKVHFIPYVGIGPQKYLDLFSMKLGDSRTIKRKNKTGANYLERNTINMPRVPVLTEQSLFNEDQFIETINSNSISNVKENLMHTIVTEFFNEIGISGSDRLQSYIKYWDPKQDFGYIKTIKSGKDYGFSLINLDNKYIDELKIGTKVTFVLKEGKEGVCFAVDIEIESEKNSTKSSVIKTWDLLKGYGYIESSFGPNYVFHLNNVNPKTVDQLKEGLEVSFKTKVAKNGKEYAVEVCTLELS